MIHPPEDALLAEPPPAQVAEHLKGCPRCRVFRRLHAAALAGGPVPGLEQARASISASRHQSMASLSHELDAERRPLCRGDRVGPWRVEGRLGAGALAIVYRVRNAETGEVAALKVIDAGSAALRRRAPREAQAQLELRHPNVVPVMASLDAAGRPALLLELVPGPTLAELLDAEVLPLDQRLRLGLGLVEGVRAVHAAGLVHRDLKPANVLVDPRHGDLVARVTDFGMVKRTDAEATRLTVTGAVLGTPAYMAPEQIRDSARVDARADVFALGAMLFELVTGERAFRGASLVEVFDKIRHGDRPDVREWEPDLPDPLRQAIDGALRVDPGDRLPSAEAVAALWREGAGEPRAPEPELAEAVAALVVDRPVQGRGFTYSLGPSGTAPALVGRESLVTRLTSEVLRPSWHVLVGPPGVGTTAVATAVAEAAAPYLAGGVVLVPASEARTAGEVQEAVIAALGVSLRRRADLPASLAAHGAMLLVLDHAGADPLGEATDGWAEQAPLLRVLATSHAPVRGFRTVEVAPLPSAAARVLWAERARSPAGEETIERVLEACAGLPLAIEVAAACLAVDPALSVEPWRDLPLGVLTPEARRIWELGARFRGDFTAEALSAVLGDDVDELDLEDWLDELIDLGLVRSAGRAGAPRFRLVDALRPDGPRDLEAREERQPARSLEELLEQARTSRVAAVEALDEARKRVLPGEVAWARALLARHDGRTGELLAILPDLEGERAALVRGWLEPS